jgi:hypothetical protein
MVFIFLFLFLLVGCSMLAYDLYTAPNVDTYFSREFVDFEFKIFTHK